METLKQCPVSLRDTPSNALSVGNHDSMLKSEGLVLRRPYSGHSSGAQGPAEPDLTVFGVSRGTSVQLVLGTESGPGT